MQNTATSNQTAVLRLEAAQTIWVRNTQTPRGSQVVMGSHFEFLPPYNGRPFPACKSVDLSRYGKLRAIVPLLISVQNGASPDRDTLVCDLVNHVRIARDTHYEYGVAGDKAYYGHDLAYGSKDSGKPEDYVLGGPSRAAVYDDEITVAGFRRTEGRPDLPYAFILNVQELEDVRAAFKRAAGERWAIKNGESRGDPLKHITPHGAIQSHTVADGNLRIDVDAAGRVFGLVLGRKAQAWITVAGHRVAVGEVITVNPIREALGLPLLETVLPAAPPRERTSVNTMAKALEHAKPAFKEPAVEPVAEVTVEPEVEIVAEVTVEPEVEIVAEVTVEPEVEIVAVTTPADAPVALVTEPPAQPALPEGLCELLEGTVLEQPLVYDQGCALTGVVTREALEDVWSHMMGIMTRRNDASSFQGEDAPIEEVAAQCEEVIISMFDSAMATA